MGIWAGAHWGRWLAIGLLSVNLVSDFANAILARDARTLIGVPIAGVLILYLARSASVLRYFDGRRGTAGPSADP